jgi:hypothetical protein
VAASTAATAAGPAVGGGSAIANKILVAPVSALGLSAASLCGVAAQGCVLPLRPAAPPVAAVPPPAAPAAPPSIPAPAAGAAGLSTGAILGGLGALAALSFAVFGGDDGPVSP